MTAPAATCEHPDTALRVDVHHYRGKNTPTGAHCEDCGRRWGVGEFNVFLFKRQRAREAARRLVQGFAGRAEQVCSRCGHLYSEHFRCAGVCLHSTPDNTDPGFKVFCKCDGAA